ncbi:phosphoribosylglycinamide formyltransferase [Heliorestis acidaminivorans]|uniref:Phosphoribosylglycinamide formyltransferase n=1 Tax=Heliorestis acidaminivorans TaxID=553427 RepID=A0A6I0F1C9_9FIRM|nr:phosphoribosylglycinamide formyltransferase [Heliorestis acidaminivorans]KAB2953255.1 phosphoribosylglycinamide formyltransferase [Heliorestis acidaminivorans]
MALKIGVLASGRGSNLQSLLDAISAGTLDAEIVLVISDKQNAMALDRAAAQGVPAVHLNPKDFNDRKSYDLAIAELFKERGATAIVLAGYMRIISRPFLESFPERVINIHPALLPAFPGLHSQKQALEYGVRYSGCTVHFVDEGMDTGPIIVQAVVPVEKDDTEETLAARILQEEHRILPEALQLLAQGRLRVEGRKVQIL